MLAQLAFIERGVIAIMADLYVSHKRLTEYAGTIKRIRDWIDATLEHPTQPVSRPGTPQEQD